MLAYRRYFIQIFKQKIEKEVFIQFSFIKMAYSSSVSDEVQEEINPKKEEKEGMCCFNGELV